VKSLIKKIARSDFGIYLRNNLGLRPSPISINSKFKLTSVSDAFIWRTDNGYKTTFKYADILSLFYQIENSYVELLFYSKDNNFIKKVIINHLNYSNKLLIDKTFLDGIEDYGVFYIFHRSESYSGNDLTIANQCYVGFSINDSLSSFAHGNVYVKSQSLDGKLHGSDMVKSSLKKNIYRIQNSFKNFTKSELFFVNPLSKKIYFSIGNNKYTLHKNCSILIDVTGQKNTSIISRCMFLRPIVFNYKGGFIDIYHG